MNKHPEYPNISDIKLIQGKLPKLIHGYDVFYVNKRCEALCNECATDVLNEPDPNFQLDYAAINWESEMYCDKCSEKIDSYYPTINTPQY